MAREKMAYFFFLFLLINLVGFIANMILNFFKSVNEFAPLAINKVIK